MIYLENILSDNTRLILTTLVILTYVIGLIINSLIKNKSLPISILVIASLFIKDITYYSMLLSTLSIIEALYLIRKGAKTPAHIAMVMGLLLVLSNIPLVKEYHQMLLFFLLSIKLLSLSNKFQLTSLYISICVPVVLFGLIMNHMVPGDQYDVLCSMILVLLVGASLRYFLDITLKSPIFILFSFIFVSCLSGPVLTSAIVIYSISSVLTLLKDKNLAKITTVAIFTIPFMDSSIFASSLNDLLYYQNITNSKYLAWPLIILLSSVVIIYLKGSIKMIDKKVSITNIFLTLSFIIVAMAPFITRGFVLYSPIPLFPLIPLIILLSFYLLRFRCPDLNVLNEFIKNILLRSYNFTLYWNKSAYVNIQSIIKNISRYSYLGLNSFLRNSLLISRKFYKERSIKIKIFITVNITRGFDIIRTRIGLEELGAIIFTIMMITIFLLRR